MIDFDCAPTAEQPSPYDNRFAALDDLTRLRIEADIHHQPALRTQLDAHIVYLCALIGQQLPFDEYLSLTQGCVPRGWTRGYIEQRAMIARKALGSLGISWDERLRINKSKASFSRVDAYRFALHEALGHALQYSSLTAQAESNTVEWPRILAVHCPHQVLFEGLAQVLPRTRIDHFTNHIRGQIHILVNSGTPAVACRDLARRQVPWWTGEEIARELYDRSRNPQLRSYLWSYPAGMDWFVKLVEAGSTTLAEVLREAYRRSLTPSELHQLWPTGPAIGGNR